MNSDRRAKAAASLTVVGLAALGAAALGSNHGTAGQLAAAPSGGRAPIVTSASGSSAAATQVAGTSAGATEKAPIVSRTSGAAGSTYHDD